MHKLTIITICRNEAATIAGTIESVLGQKNRNFEYIIIDGASDDGTLEVIHNYENEIDLIVSEPDKGIFNAQNKGILNANGEYICFINAGDSFCNPGITQKVLGMNLLEDIIYGDVIIEMKKGLRYRKKSPSRPSQMYFIYDCLPHPGALFRRSMFDEIGMLDENFPATADYEFFLRSIFGQNRSARYLPFPFAVFKLGGFSIKNEKSELVQNERKTAQKMYLDESVLKNFRKYGIFHVLFGKKLRYLYYLIMSNIWSRFMKTDL